MPKPESQGTQTLGRMLPFGFRAPSNPTSPYLGQMGEQMCGPSSPRCPPPWEPELRLSFSRLHARFGGPGCSHLGVGPPLAIWGILWPGGRIPARGKMACSPHPGELFSLTGPLVHTSHLTTATLTSCKLW